MNCSNCGTPLIPGNNICPKCQSLNMPFNGPIDAQETVTTEGQKIQNIDNTIKTEQVEQKPLDMQINEDIPSQENVSMDVQNSFEMQDLNDENNSEEILETMAPPELEVNNEQLVGATVSDISSQTNVETYAPEGVEEAKTPEEIMAGREEEKVDFAIPTAQKPVEQVDLPKDGSAPTIDEETITIGEQTKQEFPTTFKLGKKELKLNFFKNKQVPKLVCIIGIAVFFILGVLIGSTIFTKNVCVSTNANRNTSKKKILVSNGKNNTTKAGAFTYSIPKDFTYDKVNGGIYIYATDNSYRIYIKAVHGLYNDLATAKTSIVASLRESSIDVANVKEVKIGESNVLTIETTSGLNNRLNGFMDAKNDYVFFMEIVNIENNYETEALEIAEDIARNAKFNEEESELEQVVVNDISSLCITASETYKSMTKND